MFEFEQLMEGLCVKDSFGRSTLLTEGEVDALLAVEPVAKAVRLGMFGAYIRYREIGGVTYNERAARERVSLIATSVYKSAWTRHVAWVHS